MIIAMHRPAHELRINQQDIDALVPRAMQQLVRANSSSALLNQHKGKGKGTTFEIHLREQIVQGDKTITRSVILKEHQPNSTAHYHRSHASGHAQTPVTLAPAIFAPLSRAHTPNRTQRDAFELVPTSAFSSQSFMFDPYPTHSRVTRDQKGKNGSMRSASLTVPGQRAHVSESSGFAPRFGR